MITTIQCHSREVTELMLIRGSRLLAGLLVAAALAFGAPAVASAGDDGRDDRREDGGTVVLGGQTGNQESNAGNAIAIGDYQGHCGYSQSGMPIWC